MELVIALVRMEIEIGMVSRKRKSVEELNVGCVLEWKLFNRNWDVGWHTEILEKSLVDVEQYRIT